MRLSDEKTFQELAELAEAMCLKFHGHSSDAWRRRKDARIVDDGRKGLLSHNSHFPLGTLMSVTRRYGLMQDDTEALYVPVHDANLTKKEQGQMANLRQVLRFRIRQEVFGRAAANIGQEELEL